MTQENYIVLDISSLASEEFIEQYLHPALQSTPAGKIIAVMQDDVSGLAEAIFEFVYNLGINGVRLAGVEAKHIIAHLVGKLPGTKTVFTNDELLTTLVGKNSHVFSKGRLVVADKYAQLHKSLFTIPGFTDNHWQELTDMSVFTRDDFISLAEQFEVNTGEILRERLIQLAAKNTTLELIVNSPLNNWATFYRLSKLRPELAEGVKQGRKFVRLEWFKRVPNRDRVLEMAARVGLKNTAEFNQYMPTQMLITRDKFNLEGIGKLLKKSRIIALDWETWAESNENFDAGYVDMFGSKIAGVGITCGVHLEKTFYFQFDHADTANNIAKALLIPLLELFPDDLPVIAHNFYFECAVLLSEFGVQFDNIYDTKIMHHHIDESSSHGLKDLSKRYLNYDQLHYENVIEKGKTMRDYSGTDIFQYGADDPLVTAHLFDLFYIILNLEGSWEFVKNHEFPSVNLLAESYFRGVSIDWESCQNQGNYDSEYSEKCIQQVRNLIKDNQNREDLARHADVWFKEEVRPTLKNLDTAEELRLSLETQFWYEDFDLVNKSGKELNLNSYIQKQELLYGMLGLPIRVRNAETSDARSKKGFKNGEPKTDKDAISEALAWGDAVGWKADVLNLMLEASQASTRCRLFYDKFPLWKHPKDGLIHPQFNSTGTDTRRPTGASPNLLQLSKRDKGIQVRSCILPNQNMGHDLICSIDWDGEELRLMAGLSGDKELTACYLGDNLKDVHAIVAAQIAGVDYDYFVAVRKGSEGESRAKEFDNVRKTAKQVNFAGSYGVGPTKLARMLHCTPTKAKSYLRAKQTAYKEFEAWKDNVVIDLHKKGFMQTMYGNRKHVYDKIFARDTVGSVERSSVNYLVQGLAADYLKVVLSNLWKKKTFQRHNAVLIAPIYDELVFSCHHTQAAALTQEVYAEMTKGIPGINIPMLANPALGINFADQVEILVDCNQILAAELIEAAISKVLPLTPTQYQKPGATEEYCPIYQNRTPKNTHSEKHVV